MSGHFTDYIPVERETFYEKDGEKFTLMYYTFKNFQKLLKKAFPDVSKIRRYFTRGFTDGKIIYLLSKRHWYARINHEYLILHEIGHIKGYKHRWYIPDIMHPFWLFRWSSFRW